MSELENNLNEEVEPFKNLAYAMKDLAAQQNNVSRKLLRALRNHEKRLARIEKHLHIQVSPKEVAE